VNGTRQLATTFALWNGHKRDHGVIVISKVDCVENGGWIEVGRFVTWCGRNFGNGFCARAKEVCSPDFLTRDALKIITKKVVQLRHSNLANTHAQWSIGAEL
jgi:hypothetical protein